MAKKLEELLRKDDFVDFDVIMGNFTKDVLVREIVSLIDTEAGRKKIKDDPDLQRNFFALLSYLYLDVWVSEKSRPTDKRHKVSTQTLPTKGVLNLIKLYSDVKVEDAYAIYS